MKYHCCEQLGIRGWKQVLEYRDEKVPAGVIERRHLTREDGQVVLSVAILGEDGFPEAEAFVPASEM